MSELNLTHSNGNKVKLTTPDTLAANKTFKLPGADGSSGQSMVTNGSGALSFANAGITMLDQWYLSTTQSASGNAAITLDTDFIRVSGNVPTAGHIGTGMTKGSGGIFSFPSTGIYHIRFVACVMINSGSTGNRYAQNPILTTHNNSTYVNRAMGLDSLGPISGESFGNPIADFIFDVTDITQNKCKFQIQSGESGWSTYNPDTGRIHTNVIFTRIGDT
mgnify:CR=1 FL=1